MWRPSPGEHEQSINIRSEAEKVSPFGRNWQAVTAGNILLGTALPAGIAAAAGAFQGTQQNQQADTIVTGELRYGSSTAGVGSDAPELP